jgi:phosphohistidine phosphatase
MALYLVQHGKSLSKDVDPQQGISEEGQADIDRIAAVARNYGIRVAEIFHSGKKRALQTAEIFAAAFDMPGKMTARDGLKPLDDVAVCAESLNAGDDLMLVGHLPFMEKLTSYLVAGDPKITVFKFQNGGIVCLDQRADDLSWHIKWALMPHIG